MRELLTSLDMGEEVPLESQEDDEQENEQEQENDEEQEGEGEEGAEGERADVEITDDGDEEMQEGAQEAADGPTSEMPEDMEDAESEEASESWRPPSGANDSRAGDYKAYTQKFDEMIQAEELCEARSSPACAPISTSSCPICRVSSDASPTVSSAG